MWSAVLYNVNDCRLQVLLYMYAETAMYKGDLRSILNKNYAWHTCEALPTVHKEKKGRQVTTTINANMQHQELIESEGRGSM